MKPKTFGPKIIVFDVDGVLVDVRGSFHKTTLDTVRFFTGKRVTREQLQDWKGRSGFNDDWKLSTAWVESLGGSATYEQVKKKFMELYWGMNGDGRPSGKGNVTKERWLLPRASLQRLKAHAELALFTGRVWQETDYTLDRCRVREFFTQIITAEDVSNPKPHGEGLLKILKGRSPSTALYLGDNVDDALAAKEAKVPFVGILPHNREARRKRMKQLKQHGALAVLGNIGELEKWLKNTRLPLGARPL